MGQSEGYVTLRTTRIEIEMQSISLQKAKILNIEAVTTVQKE
jgi:hypothetical protein